MENQLTDEVNEVELERFKLIVIQRLEEKHVQFGEPPEVRISLDAAGFMADEIAVQLVQKVWGREIQRRKCKWPADWWQAFKERWYPDWAIDRWPIRYEEYVITARELAPLMRIPHEYKGVIAIEKTRQW